MAMKIAEALILRKQLAQKIAELNPLKEQADKGYFKDTVTRIKATDPIPGAEAGTMEASGSDEVTQKTCLITPDSIYESFDAHATALRKLDAAIQEANWQNEIKDIQVPKGLE